MNTLLYAESNFPILQNKTYATREEAMSCARGDIRIVENAETGLIYNEAFRPELMIYDASYNNEQALSPAFQKHLETVATMVDEYLGNDNLVEVGCGKGFFLELLLKNGVDVRGFDRAYDGDNPRVVKEHFRPGLIETAHGLILRHVLEHVPDPYDFLCQLRLANGGKGLIYIEVPCFDWICEHRAWFDIFYEHVNYFRTIDFERMFGRVLAAGRFFGQQYLYVIADLATLRRPSFIANEAADFPIDFRAKRFRNSTSTGTDIHRKEVVWGGASKGVIFSLLRLRDGLPIDAVVDINPAKQGRYLPVTGLKVLSPSELVAGYPSETTVYLMNSNYIDEVREMSMNHFTYIGVE